MSGGVDIVSWPSECAGGRSDGVSCQQLHDVGRSERRRSYGMGPLLTPDFGIRTRDVTNIARDEYKDLSARVPREATWLVPTYLQITLLTCQGSPRRRQSWIRERRRK